MFSLNYVLDLFNFYIAVLHPSLDQWLVSSQASSFVPDNDCWLLEDDDKKLMGAV